MILYTFLSLSPIILFLLMLISLDSYKIVPPKTILKNMGYGGFSALILFLIYNLLRIASFELPFDDRFMSPVIEEIIKNCIMLILIYRHKAVFIIDGAIIGFSIGSGFAFIENIFYLYLQNTNLSSYIIRGFGTALMHGAVVSFFAMIIILHKHRYNTVKPLSISMGLFSAIIIHNLYNNALFDLVYYTVFQMIFLISIFILIFNYSEIMMRKCMERDFDDEISLLESLKRNKFKKTKKGRYLYSLKKYLPKDTAVDIICYLRIYLELSIRMKAIFTLRELQLPHELNDNDKQKINEFKFLEKNIGNTGKRILRPILNPRQIMYIQQMIENK